MKTSKDRIKELMDLYQINQTEFCRKTGIQKSALSNYLNGERTPRQDALKKIADAFSISPAWLLGYDVPIRGEIISYDISPFEYDIIRAYRQAHPVTQENICNMLHLKRDLPSSGEDVINGII